MNTISAAIVLIFLGTSLPVCCNAEALSSETARTRSAYVGLRARTVTPERNITADHGAEVTVVEYGSPADKAGILVGDIVVSYENLAVNNATDLQTFIRETPAGSSVSLGVIREGRRVMMPVQTTARGSEAPSAPPISDSILGCFKGAGIVLTAELVFTIAVCSAEALATGQTSFCGALLDTVLDDAPERSIKACIAGSGLPFLNMK